MEFKQCMRGHFYDPSVTSTCPQCAAEQAGMESFQADLGETMPGPGISGLDMDDIGVTEPVEFFPSGNGGDAMETQGLAQGNGFVTGDFGSNSMMEDYSDATQPTYLSGIAGFSPVTGWLVCVDGPAKGTDYRIRAGYNYMGRAEHMDICIAGDTKIGRERHAMIAYDSQEKIFFFGPADGKSIVRLNDKMVMNPLEIHAYDIITIGSTKLLFVPLCGERFNWDE